MTQADTRPVLVFDVNETLLDLDALCPAFERIFEKPGVMREWFNQVILYSEALSLAGSYADFSVLGNAVLGMVAEIHGVTLRDEDKQAVKAGMAALPPHPETVASLRRLHDAGFRMVTLTNNPRAVCDAQLRAAGIRDLFEALFGIDDGPKRYKPAPETYAMVARALGLPYDRLCMIACHTWDTLGATAIGMKSALVTRSGNAALAIGEQPDFIEPDLAKIADRLIAAYPADLDS